MDSMDKSTKHIESLQDMAKSARTRRDVVLSAGPSEDSHEKTIIEREEGMAAIQTLAQWVSDS
jgi:hypothetical protein